MSDWKNPDNPSSRFLGIDLTGVAMSEKRTFFGRLDDEEFQERKRQAAEKARDAREKTNDFLKRNGVRSKKGAKVAAEKTVVVAGKTQELVNKGIHKALGAEEYKKAALEVNARLSVALDSLEDAVTRRDEEILQLKNRIQELEELLKRTDV
jgi:hypothetical protein